MTTDKGLRYQQNLTRRNIAILVLPDANWFKLEPHAPIIAAAIIALQPGNYVELEPARSGTDLGGIPSA